MSEKGFGKGIDEGKPLPEGWDWLYVPQEMVPLDGMRGLNADVKNTLVPLECTARFGHRNHWKN